MYIKDLEVTLKIDENPETNTKKQNNIIDIKLPQEGVLIHKKMVYWVTFSSKLDCVSKYTIDINIIICLKTQVFLYIHF